MLGFALLADGLVRARDELHADRPATWIDVGALATILALLACLLATTSSRADAPPSSPMRV